MIIELIEFRPGLIDIDADPGNHPGKSALFDHSFGKDSGKFALSDVNIVRPFEEQSGIGKIFPGKFQCRQCDYCSGVICFGNIFKHGTCTNRFPGRSHPFPSQPSSAAGLFQRTNATAVIELTEQLFDGSIGRTGLFEDDEFAVHPDQSRALAAASRFWNSMTAHNVARVKYIAA